MITEQELLEAIAECQGQRNPKAGTCLKLASYYTILDHITDASKTVEKPVYSFAPPPYESDTEFGRAIKRMDVNEVLEIMDELMSTLSVLNPRLYNGVMRKL